jgi:hypothetical protein
MALLPGGTTQWDDIHRKLGNFAPKEKVATAEELAVEAVEAAESIEPLVNKANLDELKVVEDEVEEDTLEAIKRKRMAELKAKHKANKFGWVKHLNREDYIREVNDAGEGIWVVLLLYEEWSEVAMTFCDLLETLAKKHAHVKFLRGVASKIVESYPETNVPGVFLYRNGTCIEQTRASVFGGARVTLDSLEWVLAEKGVLETELETDPRDDPNRLVVRSGARKKPEKHDSDSEPEDHVNDRAYLSKRLGRW